MQKVNKTSAIVEVLENSEGINVTADACTANLLNDFFASVQTDETPIIGEIPMTDPKVTEKLRFTHFSEADVIKKINRLRLNKACGLDGIHVNMLKRISAFAKPLTIIFNESVYTVVIPLDWRDGNITPLSVSRKSCNTTAFLQC